MDITEKIMVHENGEVYGMKMGEKKMREEKSEEEICVVVRIFLRRR